MSKAADTDDSVSRQEPQSSAPGQMAAQAGAPAEGQWVLLSYRLPREPSGPRTAVWRKLRRLGVAQISDGLVALPASPRTREQLEWVSEEVIDSGGSAGIWIAVPGSGTQDQQLAQTMAAARAAEYHELVAAAEVAATASVVSPTAVRQLRNELRAIQRRDYFPPSARDQAEAAVQALATISEGGGSTSAPRISRQRRRADAQVEEEAR